MLPPEHYKNLSLVDIEGEIWKDIVGYEGSYQISNMGRIKSLERLSPSRWGKLYLKKAKIMKLCNVDGYLATSLYKNNCPIQMKSHKLVAIAFIPNPEHLPIVNHKKGIKWDNRATELEWVTSSENQFHSFKIGLRIPLQGENLYNAKLTNEQVIEIKLKYIPNIYGVCKLAREYNVSHVLISRILSNKQRKKC
jgi:hypothetical protein